jgi:rhodanese-related sulfurtransferase
MGAGGSFRNFRRNAANGFFKHRTFVSTAVLLAIAAAALFTAPDAVAAPPDPVFLNEIQLGEYILMPEELLYRIKSGDPDYVICDVREGELFSRMHITGAVNLPLESGELFAGYVLLPRDKDIFLVSEDGKSAFDALRFLLEKGFDRVWVVEGGMENWLYRDYLTG